MTPDEAFLHTKLAMREERIATLESQVKRMTEFDVNNRQRKIESLKQANYSLQKDFESYRERWMNRGEIIGKLNAKNDALKELVCDMWFYGYEGHMDSESQEWQMRHIDDVINRMHELGIEVGDVCG